MGAYGAKWAPMGHAGAHITAFPVAQGGAIADLVYPSLYGFGTPICQYITGLGTPCLFKTHSPEPHISPIIYDAGFRIYISFGPERVP